MAAMMAESGFAVKENATHNQAKLDLLLSQSARSAKDNRWDMAYTYANEANLLSLEVVGGSDPLAKRYIQRALYKLMPEKRVLDRVEALLNAARVMLAKNNYKATLYLTVAAYLLQRIKTPAPLILLADADMHLGRFDYAYVWANEARLLLLKSGPQVDVVLHEARNFIAGYVNRRIEHNVFSDNFVESALVAPAYHHCAYPNHEALDSLFVCWSSRSPTPTCILERVDGSVVQPAVRFADLPTFFTKHAGGGPSLRKLQLMFLFLPVGWPLESHFRTLLEAGVHQPSSFRMIKDVVVTGGDFHNITVTTFNQLFTRVLASRNYAFTDLKRLPIGVKPADFLLHPSLVASHTIEFDLLSTLYAAEAKGSSPPLARDERLRRSVCAEKVVRFPTSAIVAHIKARSGYGYEKEANGDKADNDSNTRRLLIHSAYLLDEVTALVEALKKDFLDESHSLPSKFPFKLKVTYHNADEFDTQLCGKWSNSFGEVLHVGEAKDKENPSLDNYTIAVARENQP